MNETFEFALFAFTSMFTVMNPIGVIPPYIVMTEKLTREQQTQVARKASITAMITLMLFALTGQIIFDFFDITVNSLRIVGGIIVFRIGYDMLNARLSRTQFDDESDTDYMSDIAITPLAIPIICGPGVITTAIILFEGSEDTTQQVTVFAMIAVLMLVTYIILVSGNRILSILGDSGNKVLMRIMGLILMVIAVEFFFAGLTPILQDIFQIN